MATESSGPSRIRSAAAGACLAIGAWLTLDALGLPQLGGLGTVRDLWWIGLLGGVLGAVGLGTVLWGLLGIGVAGILIVGWSPLLDRRMDLMVRADRMAPVDAVVVLSGNLTSSGRIGREAVDRLLAGIAVRHALETPNLVLTLIRQVHRSDTVSSARDQRELVAQFDPGARLELVGPATNTHEEAVAVAALANSRGWHRVAVVTSPMHTRRACATFEQAGMTVVCRPAISREYSLGAPFRSGDRLATFRDWVYEAVAARVYRVRGWLPDRAKRHDS